MVKLQKHGENIQTAKRASIQGFKARPSSLCSCTQLLKNIAVLFCLVYHFFIVLFVWLQTMLWTNKPSKNTHTHTHTILFLTECLRDLFFCSSIYSPLTFGNRWLGLFFSICPEETEVLPLWHKSRSVRCTTLLQRLFVHNAQACCH